MTPMSMAGIISGGRQVSDRRAAVTGPEGLGEVQPNGDVRPKVAIRAVVEACGAMGIPGISRSRPPRLVTALTVLWWGFVGPPSGAGRGGRAGRSRRHRRVQLVGRRRDRQADRVDRRDGVHAWATTPTRPARTSSSRNCYGPTWGRFKGRTRPAIGNHEYETKGADGYFDYFGGRGRSAGQGLVQLRARATGTSSCSTPTATRSGCGKGSEQERWLRAELAEPRQQVHAGLLGTRPGSPPTGRTATSPQVGAFWDALYDYGADLVLSGHAHSYERFAPADARREGPIPSTGIRQIVVGTGGAATTGSARPGPTARSATPTRSGSSSSR